MLLKDKVAVITGGAGLNGLGFATARLMASHGARVAVLDLARAEPAAAAAQIGDGHLGLVADVTDKASCDAAAAAVLKAFGRIDVLVNNAGITQPAKTCDITGADYDRILDVSLRGTLYMSQAVLPAMRAAKSGSIVLSLVPAVIAHPFRASICAAAQPIPEATSPGCAAITRRASLRLISAKESGGTRRTRRRLWRRSDPP